MYPCCALNQKIKEKLSEEERSQQKNSALWCDIVWSCPLNSLSSLCASDRGVLQEIFFKERNSTVQKLFLALMTTPLKLLIFQISGEWYRRSWIITEHEDPYISEHIASDSRTQSKPPTTLSAARAKKITSTGIFLAYRCFLTSLLTQFSGMFKAVKDILQQP